MPAPSPIVILGPTAGGKSELAVALAEAMADPRFDAQPGQIIGADSMQVYYHMDAGTAKPSPDARRRVVHHLIDIVEPGERFTVADWLARADALIEHLRGRGVRPIVVGGTNLYIKALLEGFFDGPPADADLRARLGELDNAKLHARLRAVDPAAADRIHPNDRKKMVRALEVFEATGRPISDWQEQWPIKPRPLVALPGRHEGTETRTHEGGTAQTTGYRHDPILIGLDWPVDEINRRINARVKAMFSPGSGEESGGELLPNEVRRLDSADLLGPPSSQARQALGYKQVLDHVAGRCTLDEAFEQTKILTRRFAKTQRTWLKRFVGVHWLAGSPWNLNRLTAEALKAVTQCKH
jgi:tRNA dimethylallyltransferase